MDFTAFLVDLNGIEPSTSRMPFKRSPESSVNRPYSIKNQDISRFISTNSEGFTRTIHFSRFSVGVNREAEYVPLFRAVFL